MANSELSSLAGLTGTKLDELRISAATAPVDVTGNSQITTSAAATYQRRPVLDEGASNVPWITYTWPWVPVALSLQPVWLRRNTTADTVLKRFLNIDSSLFAVDTMLKLSLSGRIKMASGTATLGLILNSTTVNNNANPLFTYTYGANETPGDFFVDMLLPAYGTGYTSPRGLSCYNWARKQIGTQPFKTRVVGAAAAFPNAAITSITLTGTMSVAGADDYLEIRSVDLWRCYP